MHIIQGILMWFAIVAGVLAAVGTLATILILLRDRQEEKSTKFKNLGK